MSILGFVATFVKEMSLRSTAHGLGMLYSSGFFFLLGTEVLRGSTDGGHKYVTYHKLLKDSFAA